MLTDPSLSVDPRAVFVKAVKDSIENIILYGLVAVVIGLVWRFPWWAGAVLFVGYMAFILLSAVVDLFFGWLGLLTLPGAVRHALRGDSYRLRVEGYVALAYLLRYVESAVLLGAGVYLYYKYWPQA